jgi:hypothetical protein
MDPGQWGPIHGQRGMDIVYIGLGVGFFVLAWLITLGFGRL